MSALVDGMTAEAREAIGELLTLRGQPVVLIPGTGTVIEKPGGGKDYSPGVPRPPQVFAKFNKQKLDGVDRAQTDRGTVRSVELEMIGAYDAIVVAGDHWEDFAATYTVESVDNTQPYQVKALVTAFLKAEGHSFG